MCESQGNEPGESDRESGEWDEGLEAPPRWILPSVFECFTYTVQSRSCKFVDSDLLPTPHGHWVLQVGGSRGTWLVFFSHLDGLQCFSTSVLCCTKFPEITSGMMLKMIQFHTISLKIVFHCKVTHSKLFTGRWGSGGKGIGMVIITLPHPRTAKLGSSRPTPTLSRGSRRYWKWMDWCGESDSTLKGMRNCFPLATPVRISAVHLNRPSFHTEWVQLNWETKLWLSGSQFNFLYYYITMLSHWKILLYYVILLQYHCIKKCSFLIYFVFQQCNKDKTTEFLKTSNNSSEQSDPDVKLEPHVPHTPW